MRDKLIELLIKHEGLKLKPYEDTVGKLTIGVGRNLTDNGITEEEALYLLQNDINRHETDITKFDWYNKLNSARKIVILNMSFNLGLSRLLSFKNMIKALENEDYETAAKEMLDSKWAKQVKGRAIELAEIMKKGECECYHF